MPQYMLGHTTVIVLSRATGSTLKRDCLFDLSSARFPNDFKTGSILKPDFETQIALKIVPQGMLIEFIVRQSHKPESRPTVDSA